MCHSLKKKIKLYPKHYKETKLRDKPDAKRAKKGSKSRRKQKQIGLVSIGTPPETWRLVSRVFLFFLKHDNRSVIH
jgi:hypothetical protein